MTARFGAETIDGLAQAEHDARRFRAVVDRATDLLDKGEGLPLDRCALCDAPTRRRMYHAIGGEGVPCCTACKRREEILATVRFWWR